MREVAAILVSNEEIVVLCPDEEVSRVDAMLRVSGDPESKGMEPLGNLVLGVRAAKGLGFQDTVLLDLLSSILKRDYQAWKVLFFCDETEGRIDPSRQFSYPQLEPQLKLLYTAITRSVNPLIFVETRKSKFSSIAI